jgi:hypothetical protein
MSNTYIPMDAWNKIIADIENLQKHVTENPDYRLFFHGMEVHHFQWQKATKLDQNEWLGIWIYAVGKTGDQPAFEGISVHCIALLDKWHMDEEAIRKQLQNLEVRRVEVAYKFPK